MLMRSNSINFYCLSSIDSSFSHIFILCLRFNIFFYFHGIEWILSWLLARGLNGDNLCIYYTNLNCTQSVLQVVGILNLQEGSNIILKTAVAFQVMTQLVWFFEEIHLH